jgi:hypothetical protein
MHFRDKEFPRPRPNNCYFNATFTAGRSSGYNPNRFNMKLSQWKVIAILSLLVTAGVAAGRLDRPARNLKVLPQDISDASLDSLMKTYNKALGVDCSFCHSSHKTIKDSLDYAADDNQMKEEGRKMIRLTIGINKEYFYYDTTRHPAFLNVVTCNTCHRGDPYPAGM